MEVILLRKEKSIKNFLTSIIPFFILTILGFARLKVLLNSLGTDIYALNQLFIQIFSYVSLLEAGVGTLITQMYYKFFVKNDKKNINAVYTTSKKMLNKISVLMLIVGLIISFFLKLLTNNDLSLLYMQVVFMLYLFRSVLEYFMFSPRFVLQADQKIYKINLILNIFKMVEIVIEIIILQFYKNYVVILLSSIFLRFISYYIANRKVYKEYPWLKKVNLDNSENQIKIKGMKNVIAHKLAGTVYSNTDILLASAFLKPIYVVIYSSYNYIIKFINDGIYMLASSLTASMGNVMYKEKQENKFLIFRKTNIVFMFCAAFFTIAIYISTNKFVSLWMGKDKLLNSLAFILMTVTLYTSIIYRPFYIIRDSKALYKETQTIAVLEASINFVLSLILVKKYHLTGLLLATVIAGLVNIGYPLYIYKEVFNENIKNYFYKFFKVTIFTIIMCYIFNRFNFIENANNYLTWFIYSAIYGTIIFIVTFVLFYLLSKDFRDIINEVKEMVKNKKGK